MQQYIHISKLENDSKQQGYTVCFDTGLDPRSFARTKMSQSLIEVGYIVSADGTYKKWKAAGVSETSNLLAGSLEHSRGMHSSGMRQASSQTSFMRVWGPMHPGTRLDKILNKIDSAAEDSLLAQKTAVQAVISWIKAKMFLGDTRSSLNPGAVFILNCTEAEKDIVFFAPEYLSNRCLFIEQTGGNVSEQDQIILDRYNFSYLFGMDAIAFCAGVMLYKILAKTHPYPSKDIYQDMREGVFLPVHLAAPELNKKLSDLIQTALLLPVEKKNISFLSRFNPAAEKRNSTDILTKILEIFQELSVEESIQEDNLTVNKSSIFIPVTAEKKEQTIKEKKRYLFKQNSVVNTRRFVARNKHPVLGILFGLLFVIFVAFSMSKNFSMRQTTEGMAPGTVIIAYFDAFSNLNHTFMEACIRGADKTDINAAATMYAITRVRQSHELNTGASFFTARTWIELGRDLPAPGVFGIVDLKIERLAGNEYEGMVIYRADYLLWPLNEQHPVNRNDIITLRRDRRRNWRITEIIRTES
jgi:hypothetical protein